MTADIHIHYKKDKGDVKFVSSSSLTKGDNLSEMRKTFLSNSENDLVGLKENVKKLAGYLVVEDSILEVTITRMGAFGKTTLARQVFNHDMVKKPFRWICVSQLFTRKYVWVWQTILQRLSPKHDEHRELEMSEGELQGKLFGLLETSKSFVNSQFPCSRMNKTGTKSSMVGGGVLAERSIFIFKTFLKQKGPFLLK